VTLALARCLDDPQALWEEVEAHWQRGALVGLATPQEQPLLQAAMHTAGTAASTTPERQADPPDAAQALDSDAEPGSMLRREVAATIRDHWGPALVLGSGGSSGSRHWCLQPWSHLQASAEACATWLASQGIDPEHCLHLDALPLHHVSGLMPLVRSRCWGAELRWLPPSVLRQPEQLPLACPLPADRPVLLSLVPTQLQRLIASPVALQWLRGCAVIWVGGAALPADLARHARDKALPLAPCYGATETAAMVCALPPQRFLAGDEGCGPALADVELRLEGPEQAIAVRTMRLSPGWFEAGRLRPFRDADGWWRSGDAGVWQPRRAAGGDQGSLVIRGRLDGAIHSGGETVFPDQVQQRLQGLIREAGLPVAELLLLAEPDALWGERLVALIRWRAAEDLDSGDLTGPAADSTTAEAWLNRLAELARELPPPQRPRRWLPCPELEVGGTGKWERQRWRQWLNTHDDTRHDISRASR